MECKQAHNWFASERTCAEDYDTEYPEVRSIFTKICGMDPDDMQQYVKEDAGPKHCEYAYPITLQLPRALVDLMWTYEEIYIELAP
jgi:hypothetical protein